MRDILGREVDIGDVIVVTRVVFARVSRSSYLSTEFAIIIGRSKSNPQVVTYTKLIDRQGYWAQRERAAGRPTPSNWHVYPGKTGRKLIAGAGRSRASTYLKVDYDKLPPGYQEDYQELMKKLQ